MRVYGDHPRTSSLAELNDLMRARLAAGGADSGLAGHANLVGALLSAAELGRAIADIDFADRGEDAPTPRAEAAMDLTVMLAAAVARSWRSGFTADRPDPGLLLARLARHPLKENCTVRPAEGYALYALYPEAYYEAAEAFGPGAFDEVIGLRSIGFGLAAMVAAAAGARRPFSLRPVGSPFARILAPAGSLVQRLRAHSNARVAVVDEGPGLSGSSFGAVGDLLEDAGVLPQRIVYFPSHAGGPGPQASPRHRQRWASANKALVSVDALVTHAPDPARRLATWAADLLGAPVAPLKDLSGGGWRPLTGQTDLPVWPHTERRKFLLDTGSGRYLLKFAGLGEVGEGKLARARALHDAGFCPEPKGLLHGFLAERWVDGRPLDPRESRDEVIARLGAYIGFRGRAFPVEGGGASVSALAEMARINLEEAGLDPTGLPSPAEAGRLQARVRRVVTDNRLHRWEWIRSHDGRLLKTDALDHAEGHDLVGCQDLAWDVAGAAVEFDLSDAELDTLRDAVADRAWPVDRDLLAVMRPLYIAFQIGCWRMAADAQGGDEAARCERQVDWYARRLRAGAPARSSHHHAYDGGHGRHHQEA